MKDDYSLWVIEVAAVNERAMTERESEARRLLAAARKANPGLKVACWDMMSKAKLA